MSCCFLSHDQLTPELFRSPGLSSPKYLAHLRREEAVSTHGYSNPQRDCNVSLFYLWLCCSIFSGIAAVVIISLPDTSLFPSAPLSPSPPPTPTRVAWYRTVPRQHWWFQLQPWLFFTEFRYLHQNPELEEYPRSSLAQRSWSSWQFSTSSSMVRGLDSPMPVGPFQADPLSQKSRPGLLILLLLDFHSVLLTDIPQPRNSGTSPKMKIES